MLLAYSELQWLLQSKLSKLLNVLVESGRDHESLSLRVRAVSHYLHELILESHLQKLVSLVQDQNLNILQCKALGVVNVIKKSASSRNDKVWDLLQLVSLVMDGRSSKDDSRGELCFHVLGQVLEH